MDRVVNQGWEAHLGLEAQKVRAVRAVRVGHWVRDLEAHWD
jgi:hypothetical protein